MPEVFPQDSTDTPPPSDDPAEPPESVSRPILPQTGVGCDIALSLETPDCEPPSIGWLTGMLRRVTDEAGVNGGRLALRIVDDHEMALLHERYGGVPGTTDVLTFDLRDNPTDPIEGDIVISLDEARRQAQARGHDTRKEALLYAVHGLLHLLGEDDQTDDGYDRMHRREDELLRGIGLGTVFARGESGARI